MDVLIWAYKPLKALKNKTGFLQVEESLAKELIASGDVQHPHDEPKYVEDAPVQKELKTEQKVTKEVKAKITKKAK